jgi:hypothetical protein
MKNVGKLGSKRYGFTFAKLVKANKIADPVKLLYFVISLFKCLFYFILFYFILFVRPLYTSCCQILLLHFLCIFSLILQHKLFLFVCPKNCSICEQQYPDRSLSLIYCIYWWSNLFIHFQKKSQIEWCLVGGRPVLLSSMTNSSTSIAVVHIFCRLTEMKWLAFMF